MSREDGCHLPSAICHVFSGEVASKVVAEDFSHDRCQIYIETSPLTVNHARLGLHLRTRLPMPLLRSHCILDSC